MHPAADALAPLSAPHGVIAILGNHDDEREMPAALAAKGFTVLKDARTRLTIRGEVMDFAGLRYWTYKVVEIAHVMRGAVPHAILLAHTPKRLFEAQQLAVPAVISGHTHGGQICVPGFGALVTNCDVPRSQASGLSAWHGSALRPIRCVWFPLHSGWLLP